MGQLGVGQQNYEAGVQNANSQALQAALQNLATRKSQVGTSFQSGYQTELDKIAADQASAQSDSDAAIQKLIDEAANIRAKTIAETGITPVAGSKEARLQAVAEAPSQYANFAQAVKALNPNFNAKKSGKTAVQAFPELAKAFGKKK
jgi:isopentenyl diphosphate isomerase/L-lactate dehydrogenase-like FMN-dependent dehydrogenase